MARITNAILDQQAFGRGSSQPMLDPTFGGQMGYATNYEQWISNQAYVSRNIVPIVLETPRFFQLMPDPAKWVAVYKSIMELHCRSIEGFNEELTVETDDHPFGGAGEVQQEITNVTRARSELEFTFIEKYGMPITNFFKQYIKYGMMDEETKFALVGTLEGDTPEDMLADWNTGTMLFIEPDPTHRKVVKSYIQTNMMPLGTGPITAKRDLTSPGELSTLSISFTGITQLGLGVNLMAQAILDEINFTNANPYLRPAFIQEVTADVRAATEGYKEAVETLGNSAVPGLR